MGLTQEQLQDLHRINTRVLTGKRLTGAEQDRLSIYQTEMEENDGYTLDDRVAELASLYGVKSSRPSSVRYLRGRQ